MGITDEERPGPHPPVFGRDPHTVGTANPEATLTGTVVGGEVARGKSAESFGSESAEDSGFRDASEDNPAAAQLLSVMLLEFGVVFHSIIIGLTLAVSGSDEFTILFIVRRLRPPFAATFHKLTSLRFPGHYLPPNV